jgi:hypothetical protein
MRWRLVTATSKWTATCVAAAFVAIWLGSLFVVASWARIPAPSHLIEITVYGGRLRCYESFVYLPGWTTPPPTKLKLQREPMAWGFAYKEDPWQRAPFFDSPANVDPLLRPLPSPAQLAHPAWQTRNVYIPLWAPALAATLLATAFWFFDTRARRRELRGCCTACGYNCRGLAPDVPCPECGKPMPPL